LFRSVPNGVNDTFESLLIDLLKQVEQYGQKQNNQKNQKQHSYYYTYYQQLTIGRIIPQLQKGFDFQGRVFFKVVVRSMFIETVMP
jgi:hypothetical protein